jgi:hypothetical protein
MRYSIPDPVEWEAEDATLPPTAADAALVAPAGGMPPVITDDSGSDDEPLAIDDPALPMWRTDDDQVLQLPPRHASRVLRRLQWLRRLQRIRRRRQNPFGQAAFGAQARLGAFGARPRSGGFGAVSRRRTLGAVGRVIRNARRIGALRHRRTGTRLPVFRSQVGGRPVRIVTRRRSGVRHEILTIQPELGHF